MANKTDKNQRRKVKAVIISDSHLGTYACKAPQLLQYLKSIMPETLILNGDIIDIWQFSKSYFPQSHMQVIRQIIKLIEKGTKVHYLVGNHDEALRRFIGVNVNGLTIGNKLVLNIDNKKSWIFHGDVFDVVMHHSKWLAKLGANGYGILNAINKAVNHVLRFIGVGKISMAYKIKMAVKGKNKIIGRFEQVIADLAISKGYQYAIAGHSHKPCKKEVENQQGKVMYLNSGDWVENLTSLEYFDNDWHLIYHNHKPAIITNDTDTDNKYIEPKVKKLFKTLYNDVVTSN